MNQSALCTLVLAGICSLHLIAAPAQAQTAISVSTVDSRGLPSRAQVIREWSAGIRSNANRAAKEINRDTIKAGLTPTALKLQMPSALSDSSSEGNAVVMVTRMSVTSPQAD